MISSSRIVLIGSDPPGSLPFRAMECVAYRCTEPQVALWLCRRHLRRLEQGGGLPTANEPAVGDSSGHGIFGRLDINELGMLCHECGHRFASVGVHAFRVHDLTGDQYRQRHGLEPEDSLTVPLRPGVRRRRAKQCRCGQWFTIKAKRCPDCRRAAGIVD